MEYSFISVKEGRKEGRKEGLSQAVPKIPGPELITAYLSHSLVTPKGAARDRGLNLLGQEMNHLSEWNREKFKELSGAQQRGSVAR